MDFYKFKASYGYAVNQISEAQQAYVHGGPHKRDFGAAEVLLFGELFMYNIHVCTANDIIYRY